ncbi:transcriptional regulator domain-containing protein [Agrobacterium vitis]|uniref:transcriptional regulator domain-containing protein n=1 Tax=Agrobacterium vitis TaxID=373 RepID=UPI000761F266|nr:DUF6499 domain-containing protein [Agrobacterium vitis]KAA3517803.1 hypothetical protein DXM22_08980 [Agrobacterium vitis]NOJ33049.1 hypothetical protein [Agrobacterium vitis]RCU53390.1 hypothetical protein ASB66_017305 [Agrobacterium vitis]
MEPLPDWRSPQFEEQLSRLDRSDVAFEFLRRNKNYQTDYADTVDGISSSKVKKRDAIAEFSRLWGVTFPGRSISVGPEVPPDLATAALSRYDHR